MLMVTSIWLLITARSSAVNVPRTILRLYSSSSVKNLALRPLASTNSRMPISRTRCWSSSVMDSLPKLEARRKSRSRSHCCLNASSSACSRPDSTVRSVDEGLLRSSASCLLSMSFSACCLSKSKRWSINSMRSNMEDNLVGLSITASGVVTLPQS